MSASATNMKVKELSIIDHIHLRPCMYIGRLGDGSDRFDGIYSLLKEIIDNSVNQHRSGYGNVIIVDSQNHKSIRVRDYGSGIPFDRIVLYCTEQCQGPYIPNAIGLHGIGLLVANTMCNNFVIKSFQDKMMKCVTFSKGALVKDYTEPSEEENGVEVVFEPDDDIFGDFSFREEHVSNMIHEYCYTNPSLKIQYNKNEISHPEGMEYLLSSILGNKPTLYPIVHIEDELFEVAFTHIHSTDHNFYPYVNGKSTKTSYGSECKDTHVVAFKKGFDKIMKHLCVQYNARIHNGMVACVSIRVVDPLFENSMKECLASRTMSEDGELISSYVDRVLHSKLLPYLQRHLEIVKVINEIE